MEIIDDDVIAEDSTWSSKQITDQNYTRFTVEGNPAVCEDVLEGYPLELSASWEPIQEGEGEPSQDNVRPIKGRDNVKITRKNKTQEDSITLTLPTTIYGGEVDVETGMAYKKWEGMELDGTEKWAARQVIGTYSYAINLKSRSLQGICSHYAKLTYDKVGSSTVAGTIGCYLEYSLAAIFNVPFAKVEDWKSYLAAQYAAGTPVCVAYKSIVSESFTATGGGRIYALAGTNTISTDADDLTVGGVKPLRKPIDDTRVGTDNVWSAKHTDDEIRAAVSPIDQSVKALETLGLTMQDGKICVKVERED